MCEKCDEIDKKIEHYRRLKQQIMDDAFVDGAKNLIQELEREKSALHPSQPRS
jgi:restriction endonuclease S subunit